jgi:hypothetical protein
MIALAILLAGIAGVFFALAYCQWRNLSDRPRWQRPAGFLGNLVAYVRVNFYSWHMWAGVLCLLAAAACAYLAARGV